MTYLSPSEYLDIKKFAVRFLLIGLIIFVLDKGFAYWATQAALSDFSIPDNLAHLYRGDKSADVVLFGNSKTHVNLDAAVIEKETGLSTYNWSLDGTNIEMASFLFEEYLLHNPSPKYVVIQADYGLLSKDTSGGFRSYLVSPFTNVSPHTADYFNKTWWDKGAFFLFRSKSFPNGEGIGALGRSMIKYALNRTSQTSQVDRWNGSSMMEHKVSAAEIEKQWTDSLGEQYVLNPQKPAYYQQIIDLAHQHHIGVILYEPPQWGKFSETLTEQVHQVFASFAEQNDHVKYWSFQGTPELWQHASYWNDPVHLNKDGAEVLTQKFIERLKNISK